MKPPLEDKEAYRKKLFSVLDHMDNVYLVAEKLANRIIDSAESMEEMDFARRLLQKVRQHDLSKLAGLEWDSLHRENTEDKTIFHLAINQHQQTNDHHPEYFVGGIKQMNDLQLAEFCCDLKARSGEMGTDLRTYIKNVATKKFGFSTKSKVYARIMKFVNLILDEPFKPVVKTA